MVDSPSLQAKKQARDAKRKKLEAIFKQHKEQLEIPTVSVEGESSSEYELPSTEIPTNADIVVDTNKNGNDPEKLPYLTSSYQRQQRNLTSTTSDLEQGGGGGEEKSSKDTRNKSSLSDPSPLFATENHQTNDSNLSLRDEVQSLIHHNPDGGNIQDQYTVLEKLESNPQRLFGAIAFLFFLWWFF